MAVCDVCGNDYARCFTISRDGGSGTYDSLECAIHAWAPGCPQCGVRILGHGVETPTGVFCCAHCARRGGETEAVDHLTG